MDGPGHYFRRIKTVAVSIPCVTGPYASVNCTLTLLKSSIRKTPVLGDGYAREDAEDDRFSDYFGSLQSIVTSSARTTAACSRPTSATSATCRSRTRARSASGSWSCRPIPARVTRASSTTTRSATSSCTTRSGAKPTWGP